MLARRRGYNVGDIVQWLVITPEPTTMCWLFPNNIGCTLLWSKKYDWGIRSMEGYNGIVPVAS